MTIIGNSTAAVTLSPSSPNVTITGIITGDAPIVLKGTAGTYALLATVQGGSAASFNVLNLGSIEGGDEGAGIVLARPGIVTNEGTIKAAIALLINGYDAGDYLKNTGLIADEYGGAGEGAAFAGRAGVNNAGTITGATNGILLYGGGNLTNSGTIAGATAIYAKNTASVYNTGLIDGTTAYGVEFFGTLTNAGTGRITGAKAAIAIAAGEVTNNGQVYGKQNGVYLADAGAITNTGYIAGHYAGIFISGSATSFAYITNAATGTLRGNPIGDYGIVNTAGIRANSGTIAIANAGHIYGGGNGIVIQTGAIENSGLIAGLGIGIDITSGPAAISNASHGRIEATDNAFGLNEAIVLGGGGGIDNAGSITSVGATVINISGQAVLLNSGRITGDFYGGAYGTAILGQTGSTTDVYNAATGTITASNDMLLYAGTVINDGELESSYFLGVDLKASGTVFNNGLITTRGTMPSITIGGGGAIFDSGTIINQGTAIRFAPGFDNLLEITPTAVIHGQVTLFGALALAAGATTGTLNTAQMFDVEALYVAPKATWQLPGTVFATALYNYGQITGAATAVISTAGYAYNSGQILAATTGIALTTPGYIINTGTISAASAVQLARASALYNYQGGLIAGGVTASTGAYLYNYAGATITAAATALSLSSGVAYNAGHLTAANGIVLATGTVTNAGAIKATAYAIDFTANAKTNRLILAPTSVIKGEINLGAGAVSLESGHQTGTITSQITNFSALTLAPYASWDFATQFTAPAVTNNGKLLDQAGLTITGPLTGNGTILLAAPLTLDSATAAPQHLAFTTTATTLYLADPQAFAATIQSFTTADTIDLTGITLPSIKKDAFANNVLTLTEATTSLTLTFSSIPLHDTFSLLADGQGTAIILAAPSAMSFTTPAASVLAQTPTPTYTTPTPTPSLTTATPGFLPLTYPTTPPLIPAVTLHP